MEKKFYTSELIEEKLNQSSDRKALIEKVYCDLDLSKTLKPRKVDDTENLSEDVLDISNLNVYFKTHGHDNHVIRGIDLKIKRGETFAIVGESGSGKSVFTKTLSGMNEANGKIKKGKILLKGIKIADPKIVKRNFSDEDHRKDVLKAMHERSAESCAEKALKEFDKAHEKKLKSLYAQFNKNDTEHLVNLKNEKLTTTYNNRLEYLDLFTTDKVSKALAVKAKAGLVKQNVVSKFSRSVNRIVLPREVAVAESVSADTIAKNFDAFMEKEEVKALVSTYEKGLETISSYSYDEIMKAKYASLDCYISAVKLHNQIKSFINAEIANIKKLPTSKGANNAGSHSKALEVYMTLVDIYTKSISYRNDVINHFEDSLIDLVNVEEQKQREIAAETAKTNLEAYKQELEVTASERQKVIEDLNAQINAINDESKAQREALAAEWSAKCSEQEEKNKEILSYPIFSDEERKFMKTFTTKDLLVVLDEKVQLIDLLLHREEYISQVETYKTKCLEAYETNDHKNLVTYAKLLDINLNQDFTDITNFKKRAHELEIDIEKRKASLDKNSETYQTRYDLLETEFKGKMAALDRDIEFTETKIQKKIKNANIFDSKILSDIDQDIFEVRNFVKHSTRTFRKLFRNIKFNHDMVRNLKARGIITNEYVDLAKFKTNKEWSMIRGSRIATIFQDPMTSLNPLISIGEQISEVLRLHHNLSREEAKKEAINLLAKVKIPQPEQRYKEYPFQYSGGMRQRVVIAIALACRPDILICDEPTTALDVTVQAQILKLIKDIQKEYHFTTIFITHDLGVVAGVADRIGVMYGGQIVEYGTDEDIFYRPAHPYTWALLSSLPQLAVSDEPLTYIKGNPPSFGKEIEGDAFAPRSNYAMKIDFIMEPPMTQVSETHFAKTWLLDPRAPKVKKPVIIRNLEQRMQETAKEFLVAEKGEN